MNVRPAAAIATGAMILLAAAFPAKPVPAQDSMVLGPSFLSHLEPAVAACVLDRLGAVITESSAALLVQACTRLVYAAADGPDSGARPDQLFVRCKVAGDPEWLEFRLITRNQCAAAAGRVQE